MIPDTRVDLFISFHGPEKLSAGYTMMELVAATKKLVCEHPNNFGIEPVVFLGSAARRSEIGDALLQTRPGGLALFLLTPNFFKDWLCIAALHAILEVCSDPEVNMKLRFAYLDLSADDLSDVSVKRQVSALSKFGLQADIRVARIQQTSADLCDVVRDAWECADGAVSPGKLPTIIGRTRNDSFLLLQRAFTEDDLPALRARLSLPISVTDVQVAFSMAGNRNSVTQYDVKNLYKVISYRSGTVSDEQRHKVRAYELKWVDSKMLNWGDELRKYLVSPFENNYSGALLASSSIRPKKRSRKTEADSQVVLKKSRQTGDVFKPYFEKPPLPVHQVFDFMSCSVEGNPLTAEGRLLRKVLKSFNDNVRGTVSAGGKQIIAALGMGGTGKTVALRALCYAEQVKVFSDGICFLEFGQDANDSKVIKEVARCVLKLGGRNIAKAMEYSSSLSFVLAMAAAWLCNRSVLLVCDDLWANENKFGYLQDLSKLLQHAPRSLLLISTRDRNIAAGAGERVEFAPLDAEGSKAREILLADIPDFDFRVRTTEKATEDSIQRILALCAGLPLALAIAGQGLSESVRNYNTLSEGVRRYCDSLEQDSDDIIIDRLGHYPRLALVIDSCLEDCQKWGMSNDVEQRYGRKFDMISMFKGLCVMEKQKSLPRCVLRHVWDMNDECTDAVIEKFTVYNLASRVATTVSTQQELGLLLHDLVLARCQEMARHESSRWHKRIVDAYGKKLGGDNNDEDNEEAEKSRAWWRLQEDGYILAHLSRHLVSSGQARELELLLCDIRWAMLRMKVGGWLSLNSDFEHLSGVKEYAESGIWQVYRALKESFPHALVRDNALAFYVFGLFSQEEREEPHVARLLSTIDSHFPKPWLRPVESCISVRHSREEWRKTFTATENQIIVDWEKEEVLVDGSTSAQRPPWTILQGASAIALSSDGKLIVSGSADNSIQRWDSESGEQIGFPLRGHVSDINSVALSGDGNLIVSGSSDKTIRLWNAQEGQQIGDPLIALESMVSCVAISSNGGLIVSGSLDKALRRWNGHSGDNFGDPLWGHRDSITCVAVSEDGMLIVSGSIDKTILVWHTLNGTRIDGPLIGIDVTCIAVGRNMFGPIIVMGFGNGKIRQWKLGSGGQIGDPRVVHERPVTCIAVSSNGKLVLFGSGHGAILRWDLQSEKPIGKPLTLHRSFVRCVAKSGDENVFVSWSGSNAIRQWSRIAQPGESGSSHVRSRNFDYVLCTVPTEMHSLAVDLEKQIFALGSETGFVAYCHLMK